MAVAPQKCVLERNFQLPTPLKFGSPVFHVLMEMQNWCLPLQKMGKMAVAPKKRILERNCQLLIPLKFESPVFHVLTEMQNWCRPLQKMGKMTVAPQKCKTSNYQPPLKFGSPHESFLEQRFSFYPTSHLCVVLHFLIFFVGIGNTSFSTMKDVIASVVGYSKRYLIGL